MSGIMSAVEAGTGVAIATDFGYSFGKRVKFLHMSPNQSRSASLDQRAGSALPRRNSGSAPKKRCRKIAVYRINQTFQCCLIFRVQGSICCDR